MTPPDLAQRYVAEGLWTDDTLGGLIARNASAHPGNVLRVYSDARPWSGTFRDVDRAARSLARVLRDEGVRDGDAILMQLPNWAEAAVVFWAAAYLGAVVVPVVHFYGPKELGYIVQTMRPHVVVTPDRFRSLDYLTAYEPLLADQPQSRWLVVGEPTGLPRGARDLAGLLDGEPLLEPAGVDPGAPILAAFTSGTTREPKGVLHSHRSLHAEIRQAGGSATAPWRVLTGLPIGHFGGMLGAFLRPLLVDSDIHLVDVWDPVTVLRLLLAEDLVTAGGATYFLTSLLDHPDFREEHLAHLPIFGLGGSPVPVAVTERASRLGIQVFRSYGSTEHPSITGCTLEDPEVKRLTTDGHPLAGCEIRLDEDGQILSRGPELCLGYTDPALTAAAFDADGWYRTGDIGVLDDEGCLTITDRVSDVIIRGGENISAQEVEELLLRMEGIAEVAVVAEPDPRLGEHAAAVVTLREGAPVPGIEQVRAHLGGAGLGKQKWPEAVYVVPDLPRTASGKVQKFRLRQQLRDGVPVGAPRACRTS